MSTHPGHSIFKLISDPAILIKQEEEKLIIIEANLAYEILTGINRNLLIGTDLANLSNLPSESKLFFEQPSIKTAITNSIKEQSANKLTLLNSFVTNDDSTLSVEHIPVFNPKDGSVLIIQSLVAFKNTNRGFPQQDSELRFERLIENGSDMIAILDSQGNYKYVSPTSEVILGIAPSYFIGKNAFDFIHPDDKNEVFTAFSSLSESKRIAIKPFRFSSGTDEWRWVETVINDLRSDPSIMGIVANSRDITEKVETEQALLISNERYTYVTKATSDAIWEWDINDESLYWGEGFSALFGFENPPGFVDVTSWISRLHPDDIERVEAGIYGVIESSGTNWRDEYRYLKEDGTWAYVVDKGFVIRDKDGKACRMVGAMYDITKRKKEEQQLRLLESMVRHTKDAVMITDAACDEPGPKITYINQAFTEMTGYSIKESLGQSLTFLFGKNTEEKAKNELNASMNNFQPNEVNMISYKKDGTEFCMNIAITPLSDEKGDFTHWLAIQRDVTEKVKYYSAIEQQNERLKEISWMQSHVLRAPLTRLLGLTYILKNKIPQQKMTDEEILNEIENSARELDVIIKKIVLRSDELEDLN